MHLASLAPPYHDIIHRDPSTNNYFHRFYRDFIMTGGDKGQDSGAASPAPRKKGPATVDTLR
jgi:hypothetical protein